MDHLKPIGFTGYKLDELTPNRTRRAQVSAVADPSTVGVAHAASLWWIDYMIDPARLIPANSP